MSDLLIGFIYGSLLSLMCDLLCEPIRNKWRRDCKFDCSKCKVWDCQKNVCDSKKRKYLSKKEGVDNE